MKSILVIAPHADDEVLGVGGTIAKKVNQGYTVYTAILTNATKGYPEKYSQERLTKVRDEARRANEVLGVKDVIFEDFPAPALDQYPGFRMSEAVSAILQKICPEEIYIPFRGDIHNDHKAVFDACMVAARPVGNYSVKKIYAYETMSETEWAYPFAGEGFQPNRFEIIEEDHFKKKLLAMDVYKTQLKDFPNPRSLGALDALARYRGSTISVKYAEAFMVIREIE